MKSINVKRVNHTSGVIIGGRGEKDTNGRDPRYPGWQSGEWESAENCGARGDRKLQRIPPFLPSPPHFGAMDNYGANDIHIYAVTILVDCSRYNELLER